VRQATLRIEGMSCGHCLNAVHRALSSVPGLRIDAVRLGGADVSYDETTTTASDLENAVVEAGYPATVQPSNDS